MSSHFFVAEKRSTVCYSSWFFPNYKIWNFSWTIFEEILQAHWKCSMAHFDYGSYQFFDAEKGLLPLGFDSSLTFWGTVLKLLKQGFVAFLNMVLTLFCTTILFQSAYLNVRAIFSLVERHLKGSSKQVGMLFNFILAFFPGFETVLAWVQATWESAQSQFKHSYIANFNTV